MMNRGYPSTARGQARSPPRRDSLQPQDSRGTSSFKNQAVVQQDLNIDDFGDMGSDEDDFQSLSSNFVPPKPPAKPQYNLVPYGFLRDDDELVEEDYDGVPIDDTSLQNSPKKQPWQSSPQKSQPEEIRGAPISVLGSISRLGSQLSNLSKNTTSQDSISRSRPGLGISTIDSNINKMNNNNRQLRAGRWDKRSDPPSKPSPSFVHSSDDGSTFLKTSSKPIGGNTSFLRRIDDPFSKMGNKPISSGNNTRFVSAQDSSNTFLQSRDNTPRWNDKPKPAQRSTGVLAEKGQDSPQMLKAQVQPSQNQMFTPTTVATTSAQLELLQAAAIQQALTGLTHLSSQSGLNLIGAQNLLMQATQNPSLAAALVNTGIRSIQPNALNNPGVEALLKSAVTTSPDVTQSSSGLLTYPLRANTVGNSPTPRKKSIPDGSGATRYPAPDVSLLVFDPSTGYRFDASTGLHYDANSGYFFNSELKVFLQWDKFTQTYLKVDNPPGVPSFHNSSTDRMSYIGGSPITPQDKGQLSSSFSNTAFPKGSHNSVAPIMNVPTSRGLVPLMNARTSTRNDDNAILSSLRAVTTDFSIAPPPLPQSVSDSRLQPIGTNLSSVAEQKAAALPNFAETSLFNKLRKAKLAQTAQTKPDRQRWGSPDPLLEAAQKHAAKTNTKITSSQGGILNMTEILQRSRKFMKQKAGNAGDESVDSQMQKESSISRSGDPGKIRSRSRSVGKPCRRSRSSERPGNRGRSSISPKQRRRPNTRGRSPTIRGSRKPSLSPARKRRPISRSRSPNNRGKTSLSPEGRRRRVTSRGRSPTGKGRGSLPEVRKRRPASKGRSPLRRIGKSSKSPDPTQRRPASKNRSPERKPRRRPSMSPELKKRIQSHTPNRSLSPKVKVVLNQSPGGSKIRVRSPGRSNKRSADRDLNAEIRKLRRKLSLSPERARALSPEKRNMKDPAGGKNELALRKPVKGRLGTREDKKKSLEKDKVTELKPIPYDTPSSNKKSSGKGKGSLSNLGNQGKDESRGKEIDKKPANMLPYKDKSGTGRLFTAVDLTADSDDDNRRGRANHRLVSERTFSSGWKREKPSPVPKLSPTKKPETSEKFAKNTVEKIGGEDTKKDDTEDIKQTEDSNDFDFLNDTLDDDKESTVIDEYEEILDYQDLEVTAELLVEESAPNLTNTDVEGVKKSLSKESIESPVLDLCIDPKDCAIQSSTSAESNLESAQNSSVEDNGLVKIPSEKAEESLGDGAVLAQGKEDADVLKDEEVLDVDIDEIELYAFEDEDEEVGESLGQLVKLPDPQKEADNNSLSADGIAEPCEEKKGFTAPNDVPLVQNNTPEKRSKTEDDDNKSSAVDEAATKMRPDILGNGERNVVGSVDNHAKLTEETSGVNKLSDTKQENRTKLDGVETKDLSSKPLNLESRKMKDVGGVTRNAAATKSKLDAQVAKKELSQQVTKDEAKDEDHDVQVSKGVSHNHVVMVSGKENNSQTETGEPLSQVRSVSDIETFLLLSSQEVEAKREQGVDSPAGKNDKKSGVFSRLGDKLPADEAGDEPTVVLELPSKTSVSAPGPSSKVSASPTKPPQPVKKVEPSATSKALDKSKKACPEDPVGMLFSDKPAAVILIGPMNFIEPLPNFQSFARKYMMRLLEQENVQFKKVNVCHEDATGAPYHYIIVSFHSVRAASDWFEKRKGRFKADEKLFKRVAGHLKQKFISGGEAFMHFTTNNWFCKKCKKMNFPPRSLCFNCFQHKNPEGFSPVTILDKGPPPYKFSNFVGAPKLKFFVTKEKVIESAPPLDGFDIQNIEMIMDEEMGFPAGICVFELPDYISAGKLKKYLNHREVEAVSVQMHDKPKSVLPGPSIVPSRKIPQKVSGSDAHKRPSEERGSLESGGTRERLPRFPSQEVHVILPTLPRDVRVPRGRSPSPVRDTRVTRGRLSTPPRDVRVPRGCSPSPVRDVRVLRGRLSTPPRDVRVPRRRSPSPSPEVQIPRGRLPSPLRDSRFSKGRLPSPLRQRHSRERVLSRSPRRHSPGYQPRTRSPGREVYQEKRYPSPGSRSLRDISPRSRQSSPRREPRRLQSRERVPGYRSPGPYRSPGSPPIYRSRSPVYDPPRSRSPSPKYRSPSPIRPTKPDGRSGWSYPPPDPTNFRFEPKSGLDYDPTTTLYYEPRSCCFYNDETNEWLEYNPRTGCYALVR